MKLKLTALFVPNNDIKLGKKGNKEDCAFSRFKEKKTEKRLSFIEDHHE